MGTLVQIFTTSVLINTALLASRFKMKHSPAVSFLINLNSLSPSQVMSIPRSGPKNTLLKGDVLSWLGPFTPIKHFYFSKYFYDSESIKDLELQILKSVDSGRSASSGKYFTVIHHELPHDYHLKKNQVGVLSIVKDITFKSSSEKGDIIDQLIREKKIIGYKLDLVVNVQYISPKTLGQIIRF